MEQTLATCATAYVTADTRRMQWTIGNDSVRKTLAWQEGGSLHLAALENRTSGRVWRPAMEASPFAGGEFLLQWNDVTYSARASMPSSSVAWRAE